MKIKRSITKEYPGWVIVMNPKIGNLITYLYKNYPISRMFINFITKCIIEFAKKTGQYTNCIIDSVEDL